MTAFVLDASASVELLLDTVVGERLQSKIPPGADWWVPEHYFVEVAGALRRVLIRGAAHKALVLDAFESLVAAPLRRVQVRPLLAEAWKKRDNLTTADALYVALAEHLGAALVTADMNLVNSPGVSVATIHP